MNLITLYMWDLGIANFVQLDSTEAALVYMPAPHLESTGQSNKIKKGFVAQFYSF